MVVSCLRGIYLSWSWQLAQKIKSGGGSSTEPLYLKICQAIKDARLSGELTADQKLPTNRELAEHLDIDRSTVARAYSQLIRERVISSHVGRGSYIVGLKSKSDELSNDAHTFGKDRFSKFSDTLALQLQDLPKPPLASELISFAGGLPSSDFYPERDFEKILQDFLSSGRAGSMFDYSPSGGHSDLRAAVARRMEQDGIVFDAQNFLALSGSQQGIDLVGNVFLDAGDAVIVEDPTYFWALSNFRARQAKIVPIPLDSEGVEPEELEKRLRDLSPKFMYLMPSNQNPTGKTMSLARRMKVLELATKYGSYILEDDFSGDLVYDDKKMPALRALPGGADRVIYQSTFSKALCPGVRLGWMIAPTPILERLSQAKKASDLATNSMAQVVLTEYVNRGLYDRHLTNVNNQYRLRRDCMLGALGRLAEKLPLRFEKPCGGLFVWLRLPEKIDGIVVDTLDLLQYARREGVDFSPGYLYAGASIEGKKISDCSLRLCFTELDEAAIENGMQRLGLAITAYLSSLRSKPRSREHIFI